MEFRQLNTFITVAKLNNFTKAATFLGYSQSAVTSQIQLLEKELNVQLFERLGKSIFLTSEGEKFLVYAKQIVKLCDEAKITAATTDELKGTVTIGASESLCAVRLPRLFKEYHDRYPAVKMVLKMGNCNASQTALRENQIDAAFVISRKFHIPEFITELELPEPVVLLAFPGHPLTFKDFVHPKDIVEHTIILSQKGCSYRNIFEKRMEDAGLTPKSIIEADSIQAVKQLTISGLGITLLPRIAVEDELNRKQLIELNWGGPSFDLITQMLYHKDKWISPPLKAFIALTKEMLEH